MFIVIFLVIEVNAVPSHTPDYINFIRVYFIVYVAGDRCAPIYECKDDGGCEDLCKEEVGDGSRYYCKSKTECCCTPSTVMETCWQTLYPGNLSDCQDRCGDHRAYLKKVGKYTDCCCPHNKVAMLPK